MKGESRVRQTVKKVEKPWGYELIFAHTDRYAGKILHVNAGHALSLQYHDKKDETLYLASGEVEFQVQEGDTMVVHRLLPGESYHVRPGTRHRMTAGRATQGVW